MLQNKFDISASIFIIFLVRDDINVSLLILRSLLSAAKSRLNVAAGSFIWPLRIFDNYYVINT
jgi:hypothetical protein